MSEISPNPDFAVKEIRPQASLGDSGSCWNRNIKDYPKQLGSYSFVDSIDMSRSLLASTQFK